jgi:hypothetical protein
MTSDLHGISRLVGATRAAEPAAAASTGAGGFVTTVRHAKEIAPFETVVKKAAAEQAARTGRPGTVASTSGPLVPPPTSPTAKATKAQKSFESFALQTFIGSMLPKENSKMFGTGNAGKMWQSLLAEKLAEQITASGRLKLLPEQRGAAAAVTEPGAIDGGAFATGLQEGGARQDVAGGLPPSVLQDLVGSLKPGRSGGAR